MDRRIAASGRSQEVRVVAGLIGRPVRRSSAVRPSRSSLDEQADLDPVPRRLRDCLVQLRRPLVAGIGRIVGIGRTAGGGLRPIEVDLEDVHPKPVVGREGGATVREASPAPRSASAPGRGSGSSRPRRRWPWPPSPRCGRRSPSGRRRRRSPTATQSMTSATAAVASAPGKPGQPPHGRRRKTATNTSASSAAEAGRRDPQTDCGPPASRAGSEQRERQQQRACDDPHVARERVRPDVIEIDQDLGRQHLVGVGSRRGRSRQQQLLVDEQQLRVAGEPGATARMSSVLRDELLVKCRQLGRGPTSLISPRSTFTICGSRPGVNRPKSGRSG